MRSLSMIATLLLSALGAVAADMGSPVPGPTPDDTEVKVSHHRGRSIDNGSGTVIAAAGGTSHILTNYHVCPDAGGRITVEHKGRSYPATLLAWDAGIDLACLEVKADLPAAWIASADAKAGEPVRQWGHTGGAERPTAKVGKATGTMAGLGLVTTIDARGGDSGCGVFDAGGRLVGVCRERFTHYPGQACVSLADVRRFLRMGPPTPEPATPVPMRGRPVAMPVPCPPGGT